MNSNNSHIILCFGLAILLVIPTLGVEKPAFRLCDQPQNLLVTNIQDNQAQLNWDPVSGATSYEVRYRVSGTTTWIKITVSTTDPLLTGLYSGTIYRWNVRTHCGAESAPWSPLKKFTTTGNPACPMPTNLTNDNIGDDQADLSWDIMTNAVSYVVKYRVKNDMGIIRIHDVYRFGGLGTRYNYRILIKRSCQHKI